MEQNALLGLMEKAKEVTKQEEERSRYDKLEGEGGNETSANWKKRRQETISCF